MHILTVLCAQISQSSIQLRKLLNFTVNVKYNKTPSLLISLRRHLQQNLSVCLCLLEGIFFKCSQCSAVLYLGMITAFCMYIYIYIFNEMAIKHLINISQKKKKVWVRRLTDFPHFSGFLCARGSSEIHNSPRYQRHTFLSIVLCPSIC